MQHPFVEKVLSCLSAPLTQTDEKQEATLLEPYTYLESAPPETIKLEIFTALNKWFQMPLSQLAEIVRPLELMATGIALVDDIEDGTELRRGRPAAHKVFGVPQTINSANYAYFLAYQELLMMASKSEQDKNNASVSGLSLIQYFNDAMLAMHRGQGREMLWRDHLQCPTEEEYIQMVKDKTGGLGRGFIRYMAEYAIANGDKNYIPFFDLLCIWMQIRDDYINLQSEKYAETKGFAEDFSEGKFSFPIIHGIRAKPESKFLLNVLQQRTKDVTLKRDVVSYLKDATHSFEYTLDVLRSLEVQVRAELAKLPANPKMEAMIDRLSVYDNPH